ncbi:MFS transporter [Cupriavidus alkaliphilus]|uniref:MFS family permease n=1 Tax=Cupriavidus alkaliphilus TaxID=942866 RepID=A0A7W4VD24_9BURK|nr:MFS transporter [Cupriavidus alkaliphilus]MBB3009377.1 MFS family permease [Cupriavidus alkaliphilus]PVY69764.1 putative MFS family arabinose efflux permease [Cupriavidus alkaliphilus]SCB33776.1 Predicted arabinose efflux permease, MFS family [Cupriavidus alkaliphilus]
MSAGTRRVVAVVMLCHFIAAFAALGMPPFFALILQRSLHNDVPWLAGAFYVVPTLLAAISAPWWGRLADRFGKKPLLMRAQLGLAASFLLASYATSSSAFLAALVLQGVLGGTFSASNAYLATVASGTTLTRSLTAMQWSARAALVAAPACLGLWMGAGSPIELYRWLALLPLAAAALIAWLPAGDATGAAQRPAARSTGAGVAAPATPRQIYVLQFAFVLATVATFPYFIPDLQHRMPALSTAAAGLLFGLPHLVYLAAAPLLSRRLGLAPSLTLLATAYGTLAVALLAQAAPLELPALVAWRVLMGIAMTVGFIALHALVASVVHAGNAGRTFGWFESSSKWGGVAAGLGAGAAVSLAGQRAPYLLGAALLVPAVAYLLTARQRMSPL